MSLRFLLHPLAMVAVALLSHSGAAVAEVSTTDAAAPKEYAALLKTYVTPGGVRYAAWKSSAGDLAALKQVTDFYAGTRPPKDRAAALAWHINAYNAWILQRILDKYPTKGPLSWDPLFFRANRLVISGEKTSFDHLEQKIIRPTFKEPRVHFALNCASASCPPLSAQPFDAATLEGQLDQLTRAFVNDNPRAVRITGGSVAVSRIFEWYAEDFAAAGGVVAFIDRFRKTPLPAGAKLEFMDYDWSLNEAK